MGAGNPRFADMERYSPETFYIGAYNYKEDFEFVLEDLIERLRDELKDLGFEPEDPRDLKLSDNVDMRGWRDNAYVLFGSEIGQICISSESESDRIVIAIIPLDRGVYIDLCYNSRQFCLQEEFPEEVYKEGYYNYINNCTLEEERKIDEEIDKCYDTYLKLEFEPLKNSVIRILFNNFDGQIYYPTSAWTSGKLELENQ